MTNFPFIIVLLFLVANYESLMMHNVSCYNYLPVIVPLPLLFCSLLFPFLLLAPCFAFIFIDSCNIPLYIPHVTPVISLPATLSFVFLHLFFHVVPPIYLPLIIYVVYSFFFTSSGFFSFSGSSFSYMFLPQSPPFPISSPQQLTFPYARRVSFHFLLCHCICSFLPLTPPFLTSITFASSSSSSLNICLQLFTFHAVSPSTFLFLLYSHSFFLSLCLSSPPPPLPSPHQFLIFLNPFPS